MSSVGQTVPREQSWPGSQPYSPSRYTPRKDINDIDNVKSDQRNDYYNLDSDYNRW